MTTMEYYLAIKGNDIFTHTLIWMHLESFMLTERNQSQSSETIYFRVLHGSICMKCLGQTDPYRQEVHKQLPSAGGRGVSRNGE